MKKIVFYILKGEKNNFIKIGVTDNPYRRIAENHAALNGVNLNEIVIVSAKDSTTIRLIEQSMLHDFSSFSLKEDFSQVVGKNELLKIDCLQELIEEIKNKKNKLPEKEIEIKTTTFEELNPMFGNLKETKLKVLSIRVDLELVEKLKNKLTIIDKNISDYVRELIINDLKK